MHVKQRFKIIVRYKNSDMIYTSVGGWVSKNKMSERRATKASDCERSRWREQAKGAVRTDYLVMFSCNCKLSKRLR